MFIGQVNHGIINEQDQKVAGFLQVYSKHSEKLLNETPEPVRRQKQG